MQTKDFVAQLVEHLTFNQGVASSNLAGVTITFKNENNMKVNTDFAIVKVFWKYIPEEKATTCILENPVTKEQLQGTVKLYHKDKADKEVARKRSLAKAIVQYPKEIRTRFWQAYHSRKSQTPHQNEVSSQAILA